MTEEMPKNKRETEPTESATDNFLKDIDHATWKQLSGLSIQEQDKRWFELTQKHLLDYEKGDFKEDDFEKEESELLMLNYLGAKSLPFVNSDSHQRGFVSFPEKHFQKLEKFGNFIDIVKEELLRKTDKQKPFNILVSGIGISGKATLRSVLTKELSEKCPKQKIVSWDRDYQKIFPPKWVGDAQIIEDVHALDSDMDVNGKLRRFDGSDGIPNGYDLVVYSLSSAVTYRKNLLERGLGWLRVGKMDLTAPGKEYKMDIEERIKETACELERSLEVGKEWFKEHLKVLRELKNRGVKIIVVDPTQIFKELYGFEIDQKLVNQDFYSALESGLKKE